MKEVSSRNNLKNAHYNFIVKGLSCHALCLLEQIGLLKKLLSSKEGIHDSELITYKNGPLIKAACITLVGAKVLSMKNNFYALTKLGKNLGNNIGAFMLPFVGYKNLLAKQFLLVNNPNNWKDSDIDYPAIALSSIGFGLNELDPIVVELFRSMKPSGTICDLGCGTGEKLVKICKATNSPGLGIEKDLKVVKSSKEFVAGTSIEIICDDIFNLKGVWEDVEVALISFVYHDIPTQKKCSQFLRSLKSHFPRLQCLVVIDIVSLSEELPSIMPGFDYVHGLQGIIPRDYTKTVETFNMGGFKVRKEISVPNMPNTFVWVTTTFNKKVIKKINGLEFNSTLSNIGNL